MINSDLQAFIRASIPSVWALELLLVLRREPVRAWTAEALVQEMRASLPLVQQVLATFESAGLIQVDEAGYAYAPAAPALKSLADQLAAAYRERPVAVVKAILAAPNDKLQSFANAFRFKGGAE